MRRELARRQESDDFIKPVEGLARFMLVSCPIIAQSDVCGAVLFLSEKEGDVAGAVQVKLCEAAAGFLARQLEG